MTTRHRKSFVSLCGLGEKNEERESKTARKVAQVKERGGVRFNIHSQPGQLINYNPYLKRPVDRHFFLFWNSISNTYSIPSISWKRPLDHPCLPFSCLQSATCALGICLGPRPLCVYSLWLDLLPGEDVWVCGVIHGWDFASVIQPF